MLGSWEEWAPSGVAARLRDSCKIEVLMIGRLAASLDGDSASSA